MRVKSDVALMCWHCCGEDGGAWCCELKREVDELERERD